ncbi:UNVERIFIED_CONTAM: hypothetical protein FKN15_018758 [Acipenser sinensis]
MSPLLCSFTQRSACIEIKESEKTFTELIRSIEKIHTEVIELIGANEQAAVNQAKGHMKKAEQEIAELRRRNAELKQLSETEDHIHFLQLTLDPNTAHRNRWLSEGNRKVTCRKETQPYPDHIERFNRWAQVLCREGLSGTRCYWETKWSGEEAVIGVTYKGINRKGEDDSCAGLDGIYSMY